jgi:hypothetical protein
MCQDLLYDPLILGEPTHITPERPWAVDFGFLWLSTVNDETLFH